MHAPVPWVPETRYSLQMGIQAERFICLRSRSSRKSRRVWKYLTNLEQLASLQIYFLQKHSDCPNFEHHSCCPQWKVVVVCLWILLCPRQRWGSWPLLMHSTEFAIFWVAVRIWLCHWSYTPAQAVQRPLWHWTISPTLIQKPKGDDFNTISHLSVGPHIQH